MYHLPITVKYFCVFLDLQGHTSIWLLLKVDTFIFYPLIQKFRCFLITFYSDQKNWSDHLAHIVAKFNRGSGLISKIRNYSPQRLLNTVTFRPFNLHLHLRLSILSPKGNSTPKPHILHKKSMRIITSGLQINQWMSCIKFWDLVNHADKLPTEIFQKLLPLSEEQHEHLTWHASRSKAKGNLHYKL